MAGRTAKTAVVSDTNTTDALMKENEELKKSNENLQAMLDQILKKLNAIDENNKTNATDSTDIMQTDVELEDAFEKHEYVDIPATKPIMVICLTDGEVWLTTGRNGKVFYFNGFGTRKSIPYSDLQDVIANNRTFIEEGVVYIADKDAVRNNYLEDNYKKFLTEKKINHILDFSNSEIQNMVKHTTKTIQDTIVSILVKKLNNGEYVDMNKVDIIGKACTPPCNIASLVLKQRADY